MCLTAQTAVTEVPDNWWEMDRTDDTFPGVSAAKANTYLAGKKAEPVVVAVIDSGVDVEHEDLADVIWTNEDEIPGKRYRRRPKWLRRRHSWLELHRGCRRKERELRKPGSGAAVQSAESQVQQP